MLCNFDIRTFCDSKECSNHVTFVQALIQSRFGLCGNRQMMGHLLTFGVRVQQERLRESQRRVDPGGCAMRRMVTINRRKYKVNGPLALWHIDSNHKLIR